MKIKVKNEEALIKYFNSTLSPLRHLLGSISIDEGDSFLDDDYGSYFLKGLGFGIYESPSGSFILKTSDDLFEFELIQGFRKWSYRSNGRYEIPETLGARLKVLLVDVLTDFTKFTLPLSSVEFLCSMKFYDIEVHREDSGEYRICLW